MIIDVYDDVLEQHVAEYISMEMKEQSWRYDYHSNTLLPNKHWHIFCGHNPKEVVDNGYEWVLPIWDAIKTKYQFSEKYDVDEFIRIYMNAHTHGLEPHIHRDDGDFTMIYYPRLDWTVEYGGGTVVNGQLIDYVGNRLVVFDAYLPHQAQSVSRECYELRTAIVFKCITSHSKWEKLKDEMSRAKFTIVEES
jgi:hypothetical protein